MLALVEMAMREELTLMYLNLFGKANAVHDDTDPAAFRRKKCQLQKLSLN